jgi:hypothetical protein
MGVAGGKGCNGRAVDAAAAFGLRRLGAAFGLGDMSPSSKARTCPRTPKRLLASPPVYPLLHPGGIIAWVSTARSTRICFFLPSDTDYEIGMKICGKFARKTNLSLHMLF